MKGADQGTPLNWASRGTQAGADMVRLLLSRGAAIESQDSSKSTPLVQAAHVSFIFFNSWHEKCLFCSCIQELYFHLSLIFQMFVLYHHYLLVDWE